MDKIIKKYGDSNIITLDAEDMKINELETGDIISITITKIRKGKKVARFIHERRKTKIK